MKVLILIGLLMAPPANAIGAGDFNVNVVSSNQQSQLVSSKPDGTVQGKFDLERGFTGAEVLSLETFKAQSKNYIFLDFFRGYSGSSSMRACREAYLFLIIDSGEIRKIKSLVYQCSNQDDGKETGEENFKKTYKLDKAKATLSF